MKEVSITPEMRKVLDDFINYGVAVRKEIADLRESFNERIKEVAEKTDIDKKILRKAVKLAYEKEKMGEEVLEKEMEIIDFVKDLITK